MNILFCTAFVAIFAVTNGLSVQSLQDNSRNVELSDTQTCQTCKLIVKDVLELLHKEETQVQIKKEIKKICDNLTEEKRLKCNLLVDEYEEKILNMLIDSVTPAQICHILKKCTTPAESIPAVQSLEEVGVDSKNIEVSDTAKCEVCKLVVKGAVELIHAGETEAKIEKLIKKVCNGLPGVLSTECNFLVDQWGQQIFDLLINSVNPADVCRILKQCPSQVESIPETNIVPEIEEPTVGSPKCSVCEFVMKEIKSMLNDDHNEDEIAKAVRKVCKHVPGVLQQECNHLVDEYGMQIIKLLANSVHPDKICGAIKLCSSQFEILQKPIVVPVAEVNNVGSVECSVCKFALKEIENLLREKKTQAEIEKIVKKICGIFPGKEKRHCDNIIDRYGDRIIQLLVQGINPGQVCSIIQLC